MLINNQNISHFWVGLWSTYASFSTSADIWVQMKHIYSWGALLAFSSKNFLPTDDYSCRTFSSFNCFIILHLTSSFFFYSFSTFIQRKRGRSLVLSCLLKTFIYLTHVPASSQLRCSAYGSSDGCFCHRALYIRAHYRPPAEILLNGTGQKKAHLSVQHHAKNPNPNPNIENPTWKYILLYIYILSYGAQFDVYGHFLMSVQYKSPAGKQQPASSLPVVC